MIDEQSWRVDLKAGTMLRGVFAPPEATPGTLLRDLPRLAFTAEFLNDPPDNWTVSLPVPPEIENDWGVDMIRRGFTPLGWLGWPKGTAVRHQPTQAVWVLTGYQPVTDTWEARWPD